MSEGQAVTLGTLFPTIRFLPTEYLIVCCSEDDRPVYTFSYFRQRVNALPREKFFWCRAPTLLQWTDNPLKGYTLRLHLSHGVRWLRFGEASPP
jgi:hypothetical protein